MTNTLCERAKGIGESIGMNIDQSEKMKKSTWKRSIQKDKWQMKEYIKKGNIDDIKDILKIRLHMWDVQKNYPKNDTDIYNKPSLQKRRRYCRASAGL